VRFWGSNMGRLGWVKNGNMIGLSCVGGKWTCTLPRGTSQLVDLAISDVPYTEGKGGMISFTIQQRMV